MRNKNNWWRAQFKGRRHNNGQSRPANVCGPALSVVVARMWRRLAQKSTLRLVAWAPQTTLTA